MIDINLTVIIQAFHFFLAYSLIRHFLLKPIAGIIHQQEHEHRDLLADINRQKEQVKIHEQEKKHIWLLCQRYFAKHSPQPGDKEITHFRLDIPDLKTPVIDPECIEKQAQAIEKVILHNAASAKGKP